jgi:hypothetical protein
MASIFTNQVTATGEPEDAAALEMWLDSNEDAEIQVGWAGPGIVEFVTPSRHGPFIELYDSLRRDHPHIQLDWLYYCPGQLAAGYLTEENSEEWRECIWPSRPSSSMLDG